MTDLMIDIETLGTDPGAAILSIAAVPFSLYDNRMEAGFFYEDISLQSCLEAGLTIDADTLAWWMQQSQEAIAMAFGNMATAHPLARVLAKLEGYIVDLRAGDDLYIWGNSNRFDLGILDAAYKAVGKSYPWNFRDERDVRTIVHLLPHVKETMEFEGVPHNPVDDCRHQIKYCNKIWQIIGNSKISTSSL